MTRLLPGVADLFGSDAGPSSHCRVCGRALTNEESRAAGIGPVCRGEAGHGAGPEEETPMGVRSDFEAGTEDGVICIVDLDQGRRSVTNDADAVIEWLGENGFDLGLPVVYRDSMGHWDELRVAQGRFAGFAGLGRIITERAEAIAAIKAKREVMAGPTMADLRGQS